MKIFCLILFVIISTVSYSQEGEVKTYYPQGGIESEINFKNNIRDGKAVFYYENGKIKEERTYINGRVEGLITYYHENGNLKEMANLENGKREGPTSRFNEEGVFVSDVEYHEGIRVMPKPVEETAETKATVKTNNLKKTENLTVPPPVEEEAEVNTGYYTEAEVMPQPVGGMSAIYKRLVYPYDAKKNEIEGIVKAQLFIDEWGDVVLLEILEGPGYGLEESVRTTLYYTKFSPGLIKGKPVKMKLIMPIEFKLPKEEE